MLEVCILNVKEPLNECYKEAFLNQVSTEKKMRINRFRREIDGQRTLCGEILVKSMLANYLKRPIHTITFQKNEFGKPYLEDNPIYFNISHSGQWVVGAVSDCPVGIDVEEVKVAKSAKLDIAQRFFSEEEYRWLTSFNDEVLCQKMFYMLWSGKESYIKMIGEGLSIPLNEFELTYQEEMLLKKPYKDIEGYFETYPLENYSLVVCSKLPNN